MEPKRGLFAGGGTTVRLPRQIPFPLAMEFLLCADLIPAERAYEMGLLNAVVPREELLDAAYGYARRITANAPLAVQATKQSVWEGLGMNLREAYQNEAAISSMIFQTGGREGRTEGLRREASAELAGQVRCRPTRGSPCLIGVATRTWHPDEVGDAGAPEPFAMWDEVTRAAAAGHRDRPGGARAGSTRWTSCTRRPGSTTIPRGRLAQRLGVEPKRQHYSGIGGTTPQLLVQKPGRADPAQRARTSRWWWAPRRWRPRSGSRRGASAPSTRSSPRSKRSFPWEAPFHPAEVAHEVFQAWLTFAIFDNARRAHLGIPLDEYRTQLGEQWAALHHASRPRIPKRGSRSSGPAAEIVTATPTNRMVGYPYTKYMVSIMDVDMAGALLLASHEAADAMGVPADRRVYLRGWCYATDPVYVAEHVDLWRSPAMAHAAERGAAVRPARASTTSRTSTCTRASARP